jgi:hypothetical protein
VLGGKNHFAADRQLAEKMLASVLSARTAARENRAFMGRAVRFLAEEASVRQFLDIGTGLPTTSNVHEVTQAVAPSGLQLVPPGVVLVSEWRPDSQDARPTPAEVGIYGGVARLP